MGRHGDPVGELEAVIVEHSLRERVRAQLTVLIRRGAGQAGLAPDDPGTRFRWSLTGAGP